MKQLHAIFSGEVQGVFFRATTQELANHLNLTGYVKNLLNGRVELLAEGEEKNLEKLLNILENRFDIHDNQIAWQEATQKFQNFIIEI